MGRRQAARERPRPAAHPSVDRAADQDGCGALDRGGLLRHVRQGRCALGDARLLPVHGQPGARRRQDHCRVHLDPQLPNRLGKGANVYLASAELAAVASVLGKLPTPAEYLEYAQKLDTTAADTYRYMNFDQMEAYDKLAKTIEVSTEAKEAAKKLYG